MDSLKLDDSKLLRLLKKVRGVLNDSEWTVRVIEKPPHTAKLVKGEWTPATAIKLAKHYGEAIDDEEAEKRANATNDYILDQGQYCIEIAAWTACSDWRRLLWSERLRPYKEIAKEADRLEAKKFLTYEKSCYAAASLQIGDTLLKIEQAELSGIEYFKSYYLTRLTAEHEQVHRWISIYSRENLEHIFSTSKSVELDGGQLIADIARLMPEEARDKESVVHRLAIGFAPPDEVFDHWVDHQIVELKEKYKEKVSAQELNRLLEHLRQKAFEAKEKRDKNSGNENKISTKDIVYFNGLLQEEIKAQRS